ncbi:MAG: hypothetical protein ACRCUP_00380 [Mycoplasmatales bacterium]
MKLEKYHYSISKVLLVLLFLFTAISITNSFYIKDVAYKDVISQILYLLDINNVDLYSNFIDKIDNFDQPLFIYRFLFTTTNLVIILFLSYLNLNRTIKMENRDYFYFILINIANLSIIRYSQDLYVTYDGNSSYILYIVQILLIVLILIHSLKIYNHIKEKGSQITYSIIIRALKAIFVVGIILLSIQIVSTLFINYIAVTELANVNLANSSLAKFFEALPRDISLNELLGTKLPLDIFAVPIGDTLKESDIKFFNDSIASGLTQFVIEFVQKIIFADFNYRIYLIALFLIGVNSERFYSLRSNYYIMFAFCSLVLVSSLLYSQTDIFFLLLDAILISFMITLIYLIRKMRQNR